MARVRACNSINLKPGGIIELLLKIVNVLRMCPGFGITHGDQPARHGYGGIRAFFHIWRSQQKGFMRLKMLKDSVCKWYPSLEVEVPAALLLHVTRYSIFSNSLVILPRLRASIGVTHSYSSRPFLCALGYMQSHMQGVVTYMSPVEAFATGIKSFDRQKVCLIA